MKRGFRPRARRAFSVLELVVASLMVSLLMILLGEALIQAQGSFRNVSGTSDASDSLRKINLMLQRELIQTSVSQFGSGNSCATLGVPDGHALWFLSNRGSDGRLHFRPDDGSPFWQCNVLFYLVVPANHATLFGQTCIGGIGPGGCEQQCPHKVLIRKEIDFGPSTVVTDTTTQEALMTAAQVAPYLSQPVGYSVASMNSEAGVRQVQVAGRNLLSFQVSSPLSGTVSLDTRAVSIARARSKVALGSTPLFDSPYTFHFSLTVMPSVP